MSIAEKLTKIAENEQKVYEAGMADVINAVTQNGERQSYYVGFYGWRLTDEMLKLLPPLKPTSADQMFMYTYSADEKHQVSLKNVDIDFSQCTNFYHAFNTAGITEIGVIDARKVISSKETGLYQMFRGTDSTVLKWIDKFIVAEETDKFNLTFQQCRQLEHCIFEGCIAKNGLVLDTSTKLDKESLLSVISCLKDYSKDTSGTTHSVTLGTTNKNKLTTAEIAVATQKGWSIA